MMNISKHMQAKDMKSDRIEKCDFNDTVSSLIGKLSLAGTAEAFVFNQDKYIGVFDHTAMLRSRFDTNITKAGSFIHRTAVASPNDDLQTVAGKLISSDTNCIPLFDNNTFLGGIDIFSAIGKIDKALIKVEKHKIPVFFESERIGIIIHKMHSERFQEVALSDRNGRIIGMLRSKD